MTPPEQEAPRTPETVPEGGTCPRCGTAYEPYQEYCLECGLRLPLTQGVIPRLHAAWTRRLPWYPGDWLWPVLLALVITIAGAVVAIVATRDTSDVSREVATTEIGIAPPPTVAPPPTTPVLTTPTVTIAPTVPTEPPGSGPPPPPPPPAKPPGPISWPAGRNGYTVFLLSLPKGGGRGPAAAKAKEAIGKGLRDVGVLDSGAFSSLHPGYFVVFAGVYDSQAEAQAALSPAARAGFPHAYPRQITR